MASLVTTSNQYQATLERVRAGNMQIAEQAVGAALILGEKLAVMAQESRSLDDVRKAYDSFTRKSEVPEKQEATKAIATATAAILQIVLDDNVPQVAPVKRARPTADVEDAVEVPAPAPRALVSELDDAWSTL